MRQILCFLLFLEFSQFYAFGLGLRDGGNNVKKDSWYEKRKTTRKCSFWKWGRCTKYVSEYKYSLKCETGWVQANKFSSDCDYAICDGKTDLNDACGISYSSNYQITRDLGNVYHSGGSCSSPNVCTECNDGFYADGPYCRLCGTIDHCNHRRCTTSSNQICEWCDGEIKSNTYWRAYTRHLDNTKCQKACSWRTDSTRCYPGTCTNELASGCVCAGNFSGTHCENIDSTPTIEYNHCKFSDNGGYHVLENDPNWVTTGHSTIWTNFAAYSSISVVETAKYLQPADNRNAQHYVKDFRVGVIEEKATLLYYKGSTYVAKQTKTCNGMDRNQPVDFKHCSFSFNAWSFTHNDRVVAEFSSTNGGYVSEANRDASSTDSVKKTYYYSGQTLTREFEFHWDLENPYHCSVISGTSCTPFVNILDDLTEDPNLSFTWGGWSDDLAGLDHYEYDLFELGVDGSILIDGAGAGGSLVSSNKNVAITESSGSVVLTEPGMYSLHLVAYDKAGNFKTGRNLFLYDDKSVVDIQGNQPTYCSTASKETSYTWVTMDTNQVKVDWKDRFINIRHKNNKWLNLVQTYAPGEPKIVVYEDLYGDRINVQINNMHAIVDFQVSYQVDSSDSITTNVKDSRPFTSVSIIYNQYDILTLDWADGDQLTATVKAIDILDKTNQETIVVYRDATPPIVENVWLTKGDRLNVSVHSLEDFTKMTIEWEAYDVHSGLDSVYWRLFDSKTGVLHGHEDIIAQGHSSNLTHCEDTYSDYARGANCYCTPFQGCFHRHFQIKPEIKQDGGLTHEYDYFIEISVTIIAQLTTVLTRKITVDISPPHPGAVHDGQQGNRLPTRDGRTFLLGPVL